MKRILPLISMLLISIPIFASISTQETETTGYILEAENAIGEWLIGSFEDSVYWDSKFTQGSHAEGAYVTSEMDVGASSSMVF